MKKARRAEEQSIRILQEHDAGAKCADLCRQRGMLEGTFYAWKAKYSGMTVLEPKRLKALEDDAPDHRNRPPRGVRWELRASGDCSTCADRRK